MKIDRAISKKIQFCRGIAIIAVVCIHNCPGGYSGVIIRPLINFCVAAFLLLSGLLTTDKITDIRAFYKKRLLRVLIPYTIWSLIYTFYYGDYTGFMWKYITGQCCDIYYYVLVYMQLTLLVPIIIKLMKSKYWKFGFLISPITIIIQYFKPFPWPWSANLFLVWFIFFYFGICIRNRKIQIHVSFKNATLLWISTLVIQYAESFAWFLLANDGNMATTQIKLSSMLTSIAVGGLIYVWLTSKRPIKTNIFFDFGVLIGNYSFGIYLTHILLMRILEKTIYLIIPSRFPISIIIIFTFELIFISLFKKFFGKKISGWIGLI
ncbi:acyltransferase [Fusicatenibacter saccharivorans]|uniref:acyltransferase n=1 Tax=Fusicatenibacter saccharivorans TaxID=1150298 RepID=UPI0032BF7334